MKMFNFYRIRPKNSVFVATIFLVTFLIFIHIGVAAIGPIPPSGYGFIDGYYHPDEGDYISIGGSAPFCGSSPKSRLCISTSTPSINFGIAVKNEALQNIFQVSTSGIVVVGNYPFSYSPIYKFQTNSLIADVYNGTWADSPYVSGLFSQICSDSSYPYTYRECNLGIDVFDTATISSSISGRYDDPICIEESECTYSKISGFNSISADNLNFESPIEASKINPGVFQAGNYTFINSLGVNTSSISNLPANLSVYADPSFLSNYFSASATIKIGPTVASSAALNVGTDSGNNWLSGWNKGIRLNKNISNSLYSSIEFNGGNPILYGIGFRFNRLHFFKNTLEGDPGGNPDFYNFTISATSTGINIGQITPSSSLYVSGKLLISGSSSFRFETSTMTSGYVLTALDSTGNSTWSPPSNGITNAGQDYTMRRNASGWVGSSLLTNNSTTIKVSSTASNDSLTLLRVGSGGYFQFEKKVPNPKVSLPNDCNEDSERGRLIIDTNNNDLYVCNGAIRGWDKVSTDWYGTGWKYRKKITILGGYVKSTSLTNFPVLFHESFDSDLASKAQDSGNDITFTASDGYTRLDHEIQSFNGSTGKITAWFRIPNLVNTTDTIVYMYYGNPSIINLENPSEMWTRSGFVGVYHLDESYTDETSGGTFVDVANGYNGTGFNVSPSSSLYSWDGNSQYFDGNNDYISISDQNVFSPAFNPGFGFTVSLWAAADLNATSGFNNACGSGGGYLITKAATGSAEWGLETDRYDSLARQCASLWQSGGTTYSAASRTNSPLGSSPFLLSFTFSSTTTPTLRLVKNSTNYATSTTAIGSLSNGNAPVFIGRIYTSSTSAFNGRISEVFISNSERSYGWLWTSYNNQSSPTLFASPGPEES